MNETRWFEKFDGGNTYLCYTKVVEGIVVDDFCGLEDSCRGMSLPIVLEVTWPWQLRAVLYLVGLLYRSLWLTDTDIGTGPTKIIFQFLRYRSRV